MNNEGALCLRTKDGWITHHEETMERLVATDGSQSPSPPTIGRSVSCPRRPQERHCHIVELSRQSLERQRVCDKLRETLTNARVVRVRRVENVSLWTYYDLRRKRMADLADGEPPEERLVYGLFRCRRAR